MVNQRHHRLFTAGLQHGPGRVPYLIQLILIQGGIQIVVGSKLLSGVLPCEDRDHARLHPVIHNANRIQHAVIHLLNAHLLPREAAGNVQMLIRQQAKQTAGHQRYQTQHPVHSVLPIHFVLHHGRPLFKPSSGQGIGIPCPLCLLLFYSASAVRPMASMVRLKISVLSYKPENFSAPTPQAYTGICRPV